MATITKVRRGQRNTCRVLSTQLRVIGMDGHRLVLECAGEHDPAVIYRVTIAESDLERIVRYAPSWKL